MTVMTDSNENVNIQKRHQLQIYREPTARYSETRAVAAHLEIKEI
jgi:hypothetical protein